MSRALPDGFGQWLADGCVPGAQELADVLENTDSTTSVRLNAAKGLRGLSVAATSVPWCSTGFILGRRPVFAHVPQWHAGMLYVQDSSSMAVQAAVAEIAAKYFRPDAPICYLDACAAPGGKTIGAIEALGERGWVVANEYDRHRANILTENLAKWGAENILVCRGDTVRLSKAFAGEFDIIGADVPCSGEGMMRKDPEAVHQWSPTLVRDCVSLQREILGNILPTLRPGGFLVYSTCTFNPHEDEEQVAYLAETYGMEPLPVEALEKHPQILHGIGKYPCYRLHPGRVPGEGLFVAVLRKPSDCVPQGRKNKKAARPNSAPADALRFVRDYLGSGFVAYVGGENLYALPARWADKMSQTGGLDVLSRGIHAATLRGRDWVPAHPLATTNALLPGVPRADVDIETALTYLQGNAIPLPEGTPKGFVAVCHPAGHPIGWVKNLGKRANNLFPQHLRLKTAPTDVADCLI